MTIVHLSKQRGQGMVEYIIILALIAIAAIGVYSLFGRTIRNQASALAVEFSGNSGQDSSDKSRTASGKAVDEADKKKDMKGFTGNNGL